MGTAGVAPDHESALVWLDGRIMAPGEATVSAFDHGVTVGDGVFETILIRNAVPFALTRHLDRLRDSAAGLGIAAGGVLGDDQERVRSACEELMAAWVDHSPDGGALGRLRITLTAGVAPLGSGRGDHPPTLMLAAAPLSPAADTTAVATVPWRRNELGATAGLKTTSYAENVIALAAAHEIGATEALLANVAGNLCEGTGSNVFVGVDGQLVTPPLTSGCLAGVTRALLLETGCAVEADLPFSILGDASEVLLTSTTREVQAVHRIDDRDLGGAPGPLTRAAMAAFAEVARNDDP